MKLSTARRGAIRTAIHREITDLRLDLIRSGCHPITSKADHIIAQAETPIYRRVLAVLDANSGGRG